MLFKKNETMRLLGYQCIFPLFEREEIVNQYRDVFEAIEERSPLMNEVECISLFVLGYIWGKRDERAKRKRADIKK